MLGQRMIRRLSPQSSRDPREHASDDSDELGGLAEVLEPGPGFPVAPLPLHDIAFADTVIARELLDEPPPPSRPILVHEPGGQTQCVTPLAFPVPEAMADASIETRMRVSMRRSIDEMREAWEATAELALPELGGKPPSPASIFLKRLVAVFSSWEWDTADWTRAVIIGSAVFLVAGTIGVSAMDFGPSAGASSSAEVRAPRTLEQHTGRAGVVRHKATR